MKTKTEKFNKELIEKIKDFQHEAGVYDKVYLKKTDKKFDEIKPYLTEKEIFAISIAKSHVFTGEGRGELDDVCVEIRKRLGEVINLKRKPRGKKISKN